MQSKCPSEVLLRNGQAIVLNRRPITGGHVCFSQQIVEIVLQCLHTTSILDRKSSMQVESSWVDLTWLELSRYYLGWNFNARPLPNHCYGSYTRGMDTCFAIRLNSAGYVELWLCLSGCMSNSLQNCTGISMYIHIFLCRMWDMEVSWEGFCKVVLGILMFGCSSFPCPSRTVALTRTGIACVPSNFLR